MIHLWVVNGSDCQKIDPPPRGGWGILRFVGRFGSGAWNTGFPPWLAWSGRADEIGKIGVFRRNLGGINYVHNMIDRGKPTDYFSGKKELFANDILGN